MVNLKYANRSRFMVGEEPGKNRFKKIAICHTSWRGAKVWKAKLLMKFSRLTNYFDLSIDTL